MSTFQQWFPALLVVLSILIGIIFNNVRLSDLRGHIDRGFSEQDKRIDDLKHDVDKRIDDLKDFIRSEVKRLEDRIEQRLVRP